MKEVVFQPAADIVAWVEAKVVASKFRDDAKAIGIARDGRLIGGVVFDTFCNHSCRIGVASDGSDRWMNKEFILTVFSYPFMQLGLRRISALVSVNNEASLRFVRHFGFTEEGRVREDGDDGEDLLLFGLLARECQFLPHTFTGKRRKSGV